MKVPHFSFLTTNSELIFRDDRKGLYAIDLEELRYSGKADWGKLRVFENQSAKNRVCAPLSLWQ